MGLKIGEFARIALVSVSALRYYNEVGLLKPAEVDHWTGYRYYNMDQLPMLNRILALKDLGLSLEQIRTLIVEELPTDQIRGMLRLKRAELQEQSRQIDERLTRVETRLLQIEMEGKMPDYDVMIKRVEPVRAAVLHSTIPNMEEVNPTFNRLFDEALGYVAKNNGNVTGPTFDLWYDSPEQQPEDLHVAVAIPTDSDIPASDHIKIEELPAVAQVAFTIHKGSFATLQQAYGALIGWINNNGYRINGPNREIYLEYDREGDPNKWVTELQLPVEKA